MDCDEPRYLIVGAGPGGLQLAYFLKKAGLDYLVVEANAVPGSFFQTYPRHRKLISINKTYTGVTDPETNLRWDWNSLLSEEFEPQIREETADYFPHADALLKHLASYAQRHDLEVRYNTRVSRIEKRERFFEVNLEGGRVLRPRYVICATGLFTPYTPAIPGIQHAEQYASVSVDPQNFLDQSVLIVGKGNSAFETADALVGTTSRIHVCSPNPVEFAWKTHFAGHLRAVNNNFIDTYLLKSQNAVLDAQIEQIEVRDEATASRRETDETWGDGRYRVHVAYAHANGEREVLYYDRIILCTGWRFDASIFGETCQPLLTISSSSASWNPGKYPKQTPEYESVNVPDLYFAGTLTAERDYEGASSPFIHGFRYNAQALKNILLAKYENTSWQSEELPSDSCGIADAILAQVNRSSAMWQQFGYLCDVVRFLPGGAARLYQSVPRDYLASGYLGPCEGYLCVTLEYGSAANFDYFSARRVHREDAANADQSKFLHPIVRYYSAEHQLLAEHHIIEDLHAVWTEPCHRDPLLAFLTETLSASQQKQQKRATGEERATGVRTAGASKPGATQ